MDAQILAFPAPIQGPRTERDSAVDAVQTSAAKMLERRLPQHLAEKIADAIMAAEPVKK